MRPVDPWDKDLPVQMVEENQTLQALRDALSLRELVFDSFPRVTMPICACFALTRTICPSWLCREA